MPCFTYGQPWNEQNYLNELKGMGAKSITKLRPEYKKFTDYKKIRNFELQAIVEHYKIKPRDYKFLLILVWLWIPGTKLNMLLAYAVLD